MGPKRNAGDSIDVWSGPSWFNRNSSPTRRAGDCLTLLLNSTAWWAALGSLLLLCVFIFVIGLNLQRGRAPDCHCFGQLYSRPLGWTTLLRNLGFATLAAFLLWLGFHDAGPGIQTLAANHTGGFAGAALVLVLIGFALFYWQRNRSRDTDDGQATESAKTKGLPTDAIAPAFELPGYDGRKGSLEQLLKPEKPVMLIFSNPNCGPCAALFHEVGHWQRDHSELITIAIISQGTIKDNFVNTARNNLKSVFLQQQREVAEAYAAQLTPTAVIVRANGRIGSAVAAGADEIRALLLDTIGTGRHENTGVPAQS